MRRFGRAGGGKGESQPLSPSVAAVRRAKSISEPGLLKAGCGEEDSKICKPDQEAGAALRA